MCEPNTKESTFCSHIGHNAEHHDAFWQELTDELRHWRTKFPRFVGGLDANAHFDREHVPLAGSCGLEEKANYAGTKLLKLLEVVGGFLPSAFDEFHMGVSETWYSNANGSKARCDYFILPQVGEVVAFRLMSTHALMLETRVLTTPRWLWNSRQWCKE